MIMPKEPRQRPVSCRFCRSRKLRCSRQAPCTNCAARGIQCDLQHTVGPSTSNPGDSEPDVLQRLQRLEALLLAQNREPQPDPKNTHSLDSPPAQPHQLGVSSQVQSLDSDVAWLESIYSGQGPSDRIPSEKLIFKTCLVRRIQTAQTYVYQPDHFDGIEPSRCIWLPPYEEVQILLQKFIRNVNHFPYVALVPSLPSIIEEIYKDLNQHHHVKPGRAILLLSIIAGATHAWVEADCELGVFDTAAEANAQTSLWVKATQDVLDIAHRVTHISLEGVQGIIILAFMLASWEGFSRRCRSMYTMAIMLARELRLHRIDHPSNAVNARTAQAEVGRRVWWYLVASEWSIATGRFFGVIEGVYSCHPRQMITRKPLNINDDEIYDGMDRVEKPMSQPTTMSYSLQRIRLGEISRKIVDRTPLAAAHLGGLSHDDVMDIDTDVQILLNEIPSFFSMTTPQLVESFGLTLERAADIFYQGHTHHFLLYSQRCKLHLPYFTRGYVDTSFSTSRDLCLKSARFIIQSNLEMEAVGRETDKRFQFAGLLVGVFMASIVLLMDLCVNKSSLHHEQQRAEVAKAFKILDGAKNESPTTAKFVESLILILKKHKVTIPSEHLAGTCKRARTSQSENVIACDGLTPAPYTDSRGAFVSALESDGVGEGLVNSSIEDEDLSSYFDELAQSFEAGNDVGNFDWDNIFSGLNSSFI